MIIGIGIYHVVVTWGIAPEQQSTTNIFGLKFQKIWRWFRFSCIHLFYWGILIEFSIQNIRSSLLLSFFVFNDHVQRSLWPLSLWCWWWWNTSTIIFSNRDRNMFSIFFFQLIVGVDWKFSFHFCAYSNTKTSNRRNFPLSLSLSLYLTFRLKN